MSSQTDSKCNLVRYPISLRRIQWWRSVEAGSESTPESGALGTSPITAVSSASIRMHRGDSQDGSDTSVSGCRAAVARP